MTAKRSGVLTPEPLHVSPGLVGQPLAPPWRRAAALAVDYVILILPALAVALSVAALSLRHSDPRAFDGIWTLLRGKPPPAETRAAWGAVAPLLSRLEAPGLPPEALVAGERGDWPGVTHALEGYDLTVALAIGEKEEVKMPKGAILLQVDKLIPRPLRALALFGVAALYFTLLHASRRGQTLGKRVLGLRVVQLGGERLSLLESFERAAGYLEIPASLGLSLLSLWRDPNRRLPHDRIAHTVVLQVPPVPRPPRPQKPKAPRPEKGGGGKR